MIFRLKKCSKVINALYAEDTLKLIAKKRNISSLYLPDLRPTLLLRNQICIYISTQFREMSLDICTPILYLLQLLMKEGLLIN